MEGASGQSFHATVTDSRVQSCASDLIAKMAFGAGVAALVDTYSHCLDLLHTLKRRTKRAGPGPDGDRQSLLRRSLRADRGQIQRSYSSQLSTKGSELELGDGGIPMTLGSVVVLTAALRTRQISHQSHLEKAQGVHSQDPPWICESAPRL